MYAKIKALKLRKGNKISGVLYSYALAYLFTQYTLTFIIGETYFILPFCIIMALSLTTFITLRKVRGVQIDQESGMSYRELLKKYVIGSILLVGISLVIVFINILCLLISPLFGILSIVLSLFCMFINVILLPAIKIIPMLYIADGLDVKTSLTKTVHLIRSNRMVISKIMGKVFMGEFLFYFIICFLFGTNVMIGIFMNLTGLVVLPSFYSLLSFIWLFIYGYLFSDALLGMICLYEEYEDPEVPNQSRFDIESIFDFAD